MQKKLLIVAVIVGVLLMASITFVLANRLYKTQPPQAEPATADQQAEPQPVPAAQVVPGAYQDYSSASVATTSGAKILFFHAQWCPQCRALDADIKASQIPSGVTIFKVNYDTAQELRQKYGVTLQTTLVRIDDQGNLVKKYVAYNTPTLAALKANLLE